LDQAKFISIKFDGPELFEDPISIESATLPDDLESYFQETFESEEEEQDEGAGFVTIDGEPTKVPEIPRRVVAPLETSWVADKLTVVHSGDASLLEWSSLANLIRSLKADLISFASDLDQTNVDQRICDRLSEIAKELPDNPSEFSEKVFEVWHRFRPVFHYGAIGRQEHSEYIQARFLAVESNVRDILSSFPEWRKYEFTCQQMRMPDDFDPYYLTKCKTELRSVLSKHPDKIDLSVVNAIDRVETVETEKYFMAKGETYDAISSFTNVISRILQSVLDEISKGGLDGIRDATKKLVVAVLVGGGATCVWIAGTVLGLYPWLTQAWTFLRKLFGV
jgi:hypothetical protein